MSQWGRIKLNMDAGSQFTNVAADVQPTVVNESARTYLGMTAGGKFDFSFIKAGVLEIKRLVLDLTTATTFALTLVVTNESGTQEIVLLNNTDLGGVVGMWTPAERLVIDVSHGDELYLVTTGASGAMSVDLLVSSW